MNALRAILAILGAAYFLAFIPILVLQLDLEPEERWWGKRRALR